MQFYIVPTPIGNFEDITLRALDVLKKVDVIACEDTRVTGKLLEHHQIKNRMICYNDFSNDDNRQGIINLINQGKSVALVSDAGTPLISDPGYKLIKELEKNDIKITALAGASSVTTALTLSGISSDKFMFCGFLPNKSKARINFLEKYTVLDSTLIFFESARRLLKTIEDMQKIYPNRNISVLRELTKTFEEKIAGNFEEVLNALKAKDKILGEIVIILSPPSGSLLSDEDIKISLLDAMKTLSTKDAIDYVANNYQLKRKHVYQLALEIK